MIRLVLETVPWLGNVWIENVIFYLLLVLALTVFLNIFLKYRKFTKLDKNRHKYVKLVAPKLKALEVNDAIKISEEFINETHLAKIVGLGLKEYLKETSESTPRDVVFKIVNNNMERFANVLRYEYEKGIGFLDAVGRASPFIGVLGGSPITFAIGIIIAMPAIWFAAYERNKANMLAIEMKNSSSELLEWLEKKL